MRSAEEHAVAVAIIDLMIGVGVVVDDTEGYAYLQSQGEDDDAEPLPRLVRRRSLTFNVSLLLVLLRKRLVEFETTGGEGKLVLSRDQIVEMLRVFLTESTNEARVLDRVDHTVKQVADLGFVRPLRGQQHQWEVRRVLKAYVDAQTLSDFAGKLSEYAAATSESRGGDGTDD